jgi:hypothetical protein
MILNLSEKILSIEKIIEKKLKKKFKKKKTKLKRMKANVVVIKSIK